MRKQKKSSRRTVLGRIFNTAVFATPFTAVMLAAMLASANVVGPDPENFNPTTDGLDFVTVQSADTLEPGIVNLGVFLDYAVNSLPHFDNLTQTNRVTLNDFLLFGHLAGGIGLTKNWDFGISLPYLINESVHDTNYSGLFYTTGLTSVEMNTKYHFSGVGQEGWSAILSTNINTLQNNPFTGGNPGPTWNLELAYEHNFGDILGAANVGYRFRQPGTQIPGVPQAPLPNDYIYSIAASHLLTSINTKIIGEVFGSYPAWEIANQSNKALSSMELLGGLKWDVTSNLAFHAGAGTALFASTGSPDWRIYGGLNYTFGPVLQKSERVESPIVKAATGEQVLDQAPKEKQEHLIATDVLFEFDSDEVKPESVKSLGKLAEYLKKPPAYKHLTIEGNTDSIGSVKYNLDLSQRRAQNVRKVLVEDFGLPANSIDAIGNGPFNPIADNGNFQGRRKNRRVDFFIQR